MGISKGTMPSGDKKKGMSWKRVILCLLLSTAIAVALWLFLEFKDGGCYIFETGQAGAFLSAGMVWVLATPLLLLRWKGRAILFTIVVVTVLLWPNVDRLPVAAAQASAVGRVRTMQQILEAYKEKHPLEGFPAVMPMIAPNQFTEKYYEFEYTPIRPRKDGLTEDYVLRATPLRPECGCTMRLITSSDRVIHRTYEDRPATSADPTFEH